MKKNLVKRFLSLCMVALVVVMSTTSVTVNMENHEILPCSDIEPDINMND